MARSRRIFTGSDSSQKVWLRLHNTDSWGGCYDIRTQARLSSLLKQSVIDGYPDLPVSCK